ncbi:MAG: ADP-ribosylglycohydrolase family protein [Armatimonadaceae bacterium]
MDDAVLNDRFTGAILGTMVGDALGAPVEGWDARSLNTRLESLAQMSKPERELMVSVFGLITGGDVPEGTARYTDDTEMMFGLAESVAEHGTINEPDIAHRFAQYFDPARGYGMGAQVILKALKKGVPWYEPAERLFGGQGSYGNGAAMRVAPVGVFFHDADTHTLRDASERQAIITHTHPLGIEGAVMQAAAVAIATRIDLAGEPLDKFRYIETVRSYLRDDQETYHDSCDKIAAMLEQSPDPVRDSEELVCGIEAHLSVPAALYAFLAYPDSFEQAVTFAVRMGNDTDTVGAMCGAIAGAFHGASAIPARWLSALENGPRGRDTAAELAQQLFRSWHRQSSA